MPVAGVSNDGPPSSPDLGATQIVMALKSKYIEATYVTEFLTQDIHYLID